MGRLSCHSRRLRAGITLALLAAMLAPPAAALADRDGRDGRDGGGGFNIGSHDGDNDRDDDRDNGRGHVIPTCGSRETLVRVDEAICPPNPRRPLIVRKRICCKNHQGRVHCDHFEHCPHESPS
jgi:hypothetical protein